MDLPALCTCVCPWMAPTKTHAARVWHCASGRCCERRREQSWRHPHTDRSGALGGKTNGVPLYNQHPKDEDDIAFANAMTGSDDVFFGKEEVGAEQPPLIVNDGNGGQMQQYTQEKARSCQIHPKDMEILHFLQCTDAGNGTSQAQKNTLLQYIKGFDTPRTRLLPSWIPTCYRRMEKVMSTYIPHNIYVTFLISCTIHPSLCELY